MPKELTVSAATLKAKEERRLLRGHLWAYRNEFQHLPEVADGALVDVYASNRRFIGRGFYQNSGGIAVRLVSRHQEDIDTGFFRERIEAARAFRDRLFPGEAAYRWLHGESDGLPGCVADRYGAVVSVQTTCAFYRERIEELAQVFLQQPGIEGVSVQIGENARQFGTVPETIELVVSGLKIGIDLSQAQKTGLFLDQRLNCQTIRPFAPGARVLDGHCYAGWWSCHAALAGAAMVLGVDTSANAIAAAEANAARNGAGGACRFECADVEVVLARGDAYDVIVLDPPAFVKSRTQLRKGLARYEALNESAMRAIVSGGILATSSCSHFVDAAAFLETLKRAAAAAQRRVVMLELRGAAPDHPVLLSMPETAYLKCAILRVF